uniref:Uncharacterized protein n=1 Tax=Arundo donax TaxID=35708 RepID=A0A0A8Y354_ARUDO
MYRRTSLRKPPSPQLSCPRTPPLHRPFCIVRLRKKLLMWNCVVRVCVSLVSFFRDRCVAGFVL